MGNRTKFNATSLQNTNPRILFFLRIWCIFTCMLVCIPKQYHMYSRRPTRIHISMNNVCIHVYRANIHALYRPTVLQILVIGAISPPERRLSPCYLSICISSSLYLCIFVSVQVFLLKLKKYPIAFPPVFPLTSFVASFQTPVILVAWISSWMTT